MDKPTQPPDPNTPAEGASPSEHDHAVHGIPPAVHEDEPTGLPTSDRHHTEITPTKP